MFDRPGGGEKAVLVQLDFGEGDFAERLSEFELLITSAAVSSVGVVTGRRAAPDAALFAGKGKVVEIAEFAHAHEADLVVFNHALSPAQQRNLERELKRRVVDRNTLILDIFAQRANSHEGKLQVELAQLQHMATRLVRGWTHLDREKGGVGMRGPGEKQLETDRRLLGKRVALLKDRLKVLERQRGVRRKSRGRSEVLAVSLVGYTNAGKSTLFNALTKAGAYAADKLFATLDTTSRRLYVEGAGQIVLSDTVGFIRDLPHSLVAAFHATLEETAQADLLLHVVDAASPAREQQIASVNEVLAEIGAAEVPQILIWNKIDATLVAPGVDTEDDLLMSNDMANSAQNSAYGKIRRVRLSAKCGDGLSLLRDALAQISNSRIPSISSYQISPDTEPETV
ncbi:MAG: GTPase HflX [Rhodocyclaceae bacterium]|nr:GTPase HflX [Rhodocyclaceae bacterium]